MKVEERLLHYINRKREEMIEIGMAEGMSSKRTIKCSQELDCLLNLYMKSPLKLVA